MLEIKPVCEHCAKALPNGSGQTMICTFECTFCRDCVVNILENVCPNCGGGFEKRPTRPAACLTKFCVTNYPVGKKEYVNPVQEQKFRCRCTGAGLPHCRSRATPHPFHQRALLESNGVKVKEP